MPEKEINKFLILSGACSLACFGMMILSFWSNVAGAEIIYSILGGVFVGIFMSILAIK